MAERKPTPDIFAAAPVDVLGDVLSGKPKTTWPQEVDYPIDRIIVGKRLRPLKDITSLKKSIEELGLLSRIVILPDGTLVAGRHRLQCAIELGWKTIPAKIVEMDEIDAELAEIDENLSRVELTVLEQAEHLLRREELMEAKGQRAPSHRPEKGETISPFSTTADIAETMGLSERSAQQRLQIARKLDDDVKSAIRSNEDIANSTTQLLELARMEPTKQRTVADMIMRGEAANVMDAARKLEPPPAPKPAPAAPVKTSYWSPQPSTGSGSSTSGVSVVTSSTGGSRQSGAELAKCVVCHRPLSDPASAVAGVGPCCAAKRAAAAAGGGEVDTEEEEQPEEDDSDEQAAKYYEVIWHDERIALMTPTKPIAIKTLTDRGFVVRISHVSQVSQGDD